MPHITVKPFDTSILKEGNRYSTTKILFRAKDLSTAGELIGVKNRDTEFILEIKKSKPNWLIKSDKITRPLDVNIIKQTLKDISKDLDIVYSNIAINDKRPTIAHQYEKRIEEFENIEFPFDSVSIEIGFGSGKHLLYQSEQNKNKLFIGIEIHTPSSQKVLKQIKLRGIENIWIVNYDARLFLEMMPSNLCDNIFVHFPVPWDKKPHRRVISSGFLIESMRVLKRGGKLELRTDSSNYFWYSLNIFLGKELSKYTVEVRKNISIDVISKYEARWRRESKDIYDIFVKSEYQSEERKINFDFNFKGIKYKDILIDKIPQKTILYDDHFIHFEKIYRVGQSAILLKLSFGSFDRPEQKYIWMDDFNCYYFESTPIKTLTNYKTHIEIKEQLSV